MRRCWWMGLVLVACENDAEITWVQFNGAEDTLTVEVTAADVSEDAVVIDLMSTTNAVVVGTADASPGAGPIGTDHVLNVEVFDDYQEIVGYVTVLVDSGERGQNTYDLIQDSADHGHWEIVLTSLGAEGETRTDSFTVSLFQSEDTVGVVDPENQESGDTDSLTSE